MYPGGIYEISIGVRFMKIFLIGMPGSGRTSVATALCQDAAYQYIDTATWLKTTFRERNKDEHINQFQDEYQLYTSNRIKLNPYLHIDNVLDIIDSKDWSKNNIIIDGLSSPKDFVHLFDINKDIVVFLNRIDNESEFKDSESIAVSVIRDYCFWMSSALLLNKERWIEYNFRIPGEDSSFVKELGSKNHVFIAKNIVRVISHLKETLNKSKE